MALLLGAPPHRLATRIPPHHSPGTPWPALHPSALALHLAFGFGLAPPLTRLPLKPLCTSLGPGPFSRRLTRLPPTLPHSGPAFCHFASLLHRQQPRTYGRASLSACLTYTALAPSHSITPLRPGRPSGQPQSRMAWCFRLSHVPSDRAGPRGSPSLGWPGPLHLYLTADRAGLKGPAPASAGLDHIPVTSPPTGPALGAAPVSDGLDHSCHVPSDRAGPRGSPRLGRSGRPDSGMRQLKSPHGEDMSLCSNSGRASAAPSRYHYDGRSSGVQPRRIAPGTGEEPTTSPGINSPSSARRPASLLDPIASPSSEGTRRDIGGAGGEGPPQPLRRLPSGDPWGSSPLGGSNSTPRVTRGADGSSFSRPGGTVGWLLNFRPGSAARPYALPGPRATSTHDSDSATASAGCNATACKSGNAQSSARYSAPKKPPHQQRGTDAQPRPSTPGD